MLGALDLYIYIYICIIPLHIDDSEIQENSVMRKNCENCVMKMLYISQLFLEKIQFTYLFYGVCLFLLSKILYPFKVIFL